MARPAHHQHVRAQHADSGLEAFLASRPILFVDSITDLSRQVMTFAKQQPEAFSERTGKPDVRGAYGLLGREVIHALKLLQHARGKTVIFVGVLEKVADEFNAVSWQPQMEGAKIGRELPGIVDQVMTMHFFDQGEDGAYAFNEKGAHRRLVLTEAPDLSALLTTINASGLTATA